LALERETLEKKGFYSEQSDILGSRRGTKDKRDKTAAAH
jgi:hypothetical protein